MLDRTEQLKLILQDYIDEKVVTDNRYSLSESICYNNKIDLISELSIDYLISSYYKHTNRLSS